MTFHLPVLSNSTPQSSFDVPDEQETYFADFQNEALLESHAPPAKSVKSLAHEEAAHEKRNWVRLSYDCNNHCTFCLDSDAHNGTMRATQDIKVQIIEGRKRGAERLILSGGEPTMHPNFLDFVKLGKLAGYRKIQTVTNGRMFRYAEFTSKAAENGLSEITFSLHGHTAKLHDALVGTPGAFEEEVAGLKTALAAKAFIINIDIVINKQNVRFLPEMLDTFIGWGVKEFDLLHIIPFGNAWSDAREHLFYDLDGNLEYLQRAFAYARRPDVHIWLNRFPPPYAEGFEDLIQDPHKLNDEVRGRREEFDRYLALGQKLHCRAPERCRHCYLQGLCDSLDEAIATNALPEVDVLRFEGNHVPTGRMPRASCARIVAATVGDACRIARSIGPAQLELELEDYTGLGEHLEPDGSLCGKSLLCCYTASLKDMRHLFKLRAKQGGGFDICVFLTRENEAEVKALRPPPPGLVLVQRNYERVSDAHQYDIDVAAFFRDYRENVPVENLPRCIAGERARPSRRLLDTAMLGADARIDMTAFAHRHIADGFYTKALRCKDCTENESCRGVHINWVRAHGYAPLSPLIKDSG